MECLGTLDVLDNQLITLGLLVEPTQPDNTDDLIINFQALIDEVRNADLPNEFQQRCLNCLYALLVCLENYSAYGEMGLNKVYAAAVAIILTGEPPQEKSPAGSVFRKVVNTIRSVNQAFTTTQNLIQNYNDVTKFLEFDGG
jgi:hypothetical protein